jgi:tRNA-specific 2-thiouridylase
VPDNDYRGFLRRRLPELEGQVSGGDFIDVQGNKLGTHDGYPFYTVGQRRGLGMAFGEPMYVAEIRPDSNTVVLGPVESLVRSRMQVYKLNAMKYPSFQSGREVVTKVRYRDAGTLSELHPKDEDQLEVHFMAGVKGVAPGQSAVFYEGDDVVGGGIIYSSVL